MAERDNRSRLSAAFAAFVVYLRWLVLAGVGAALWAVTTYLPTLRSDVGLQISDDDSGTVQSVQKVLEQFGVPLLSRVAVVQRDPNGFDTATLDSAAQHAARVNLDTMNKGMPATGIAGALPVPNMLSVPARPPTTIVTYLWGGSTLNSGELVEAAKGYASELGPDAKVVGVTGVLPVQVEQGRLVQERLKWVEIASLAAVAVILAITFRSIVAPLITLVTAVVAYLITVRLIGAASAHFGVIAPSQLQPLIVALTLGLATDYSIFFLSGMRWRVQQGWSSRAAVRASVTQNAPIVLVAGLTVAAGVASVSVARLPLFRVFGPGLAIMVLVSLIVSMTLVPALLAILGRAALWPGSRGYRRDDPAPGPPTRGQRLIRFLTHRAVAAVAVAVCLAALVVASWPLLGFRASVSSPETLPPGNPVRVAATAAAQGFPPGVLAPTEIILEQSGITSHRDELAAVQRELQAQPGVALVVGPQQQPAELEGRKVGLFVSPRGNAARYLVAFSHEPLGASGLADLDNLKQAMPGVLQRSGLADAHVKFSGASTLGVEFVSTAGDDVVRVAAAIAAVNLLLLMLFLRAVVAPVYLLICSFLSVGAALGLTTLVFQDALGHEGLIFYAPFAAAVLLVSLGSDYNIFVVGRIWDEGKSLPLREALAVAVPRSAQPVNVAGLTLAASFAFVGLIPVAPFRELAFAVAVGVLIDAFLVRSVLVPALIVLFGALSGWPSHRFVIAAPPRDAHAAQPRLARRSAPPAESCPRRPRR